MERGIDDRVGHATVFTKRRERLLVGNVALRFPAHPVSLPAVRRLPSQERFSVDGTQIDAWASLERLRAVNEEAPEEGIDGGGRNAARDFHGARSVVERDAPLYHG